MADKSRRANVGAVLAVLAVLMFFSDAFCGPARAQEQWLGYRSARSAWEHIGSTTGQKLCTQDKAPDGVAMPAFNDKEPLFALWKVDIGKLTGPAARDGGLWLALDRSGKGGLYDLLYIDTNGNGSLADEKPIRDEHAGFEWQEMVFFANFDAVRLALPGDDGTITYHAGFHYQREGTGPHKIYVSANCWYEGVVTIAGRRMLCSLIDGNANWRFGERSADSNQSDGYILRPFDPGRGPQELIDAKWTPVGQYVLVDGKYYTMDIAPDGATVTFTQASPAVGRIIPGQGVSSLKIAGPAGTFELDGNSGFVEVPQGQYRLVGYEVVRKDANGVAWCAHGAGGDGDKAIVVRAGSETKLGFGEPFTWLLEASPDGPGQHSLHLSLRDANARGARMTRDGDMPPINLRITNADKTYDCTFTMEYG